MKQISVNTTSTSQRELEGVAAKSGFITFNGAKHIKVKTRKGEFVTLIPRHSKIDQKTANGIIDVMVRFGANIKKSK